jgi:hypothetical protein
MGDSTKKVEYEITADGSGFVQTMERTAQSASGAAATIKSHFESVGGVFQAVQKQLLLITAVVAGGAFFKEAIAATNKMTGETMLLSKRLGITAEEAATLNTALGDIGTDSETYVSAFDKFAKQIKKNETGLQDLGLVTRDSNGNLRDSNTLYREALEEVGKYKPGLDQTTAAMSFFGKSVDEVMKLQKLNNAVLEEAQRKNAALGLTISKENVEASKKYKAAMNDVGDVLNAVQKAIGDAVMPVFTELATYFAESGPYVVNIFKGALTGLLVVFRSVKLAIQVFSSAVFETINLIIDQVGNLSDMFGALFRGDFKGAADAFKKWADRPIEAIRRVVSEGKAAFTEAQESFSSDVSRIWGKGTAVGAPKGGEKRMGEMDKGGGQDSGQMAAWEAELAERKLLIAERARAEGSFREMSKQEEQSYWQQILQNQVRTESESLAVRKKVAEQGLAIDKQAFEARIESLHTEREELQKNYTARIVIATTAYNETVSKYGQESKEAQKAYGEILAERRKLVEQQRLLDSSAAEARRARAATEVELERIGVQEQLSLGAISKAQELEQERVFEDRLYAIKRQALEERLQLVNQENDPEAWAQIHAQIEAAEEQHQVRMKQIKSGLNVASMQPMANMFKGAETAISASIQGILNRTMSLKQGMAAAWKGISQSIIAEMANIMAKRLTMWAAEKTFTMLGIGADAAKAGSGAASSVASVPYVGPILAIAAMAAVFAGVMGMKSNVPSAAGGFDIPGNINPITQLHANEMVLPAKHADVIRALADGGDALQAPAQPPVHIHGSPNDYIQLKDLAKAMKEAHRDFKFTGFRS